MKVKLKVSFSGTDQTWNSGDIMECNPVSAQRLIDLDYAETVSKSDNNFFVQEVKPKQTGAEEGDVIMQEVKPKIVTTTKSAKKKKKK